MKVLSLMQPWATLLVMGAKIIESRSWDTKHRGPLAVHASKSKKMAIDLCGIPGNRLFKEYIRHYTDLPYGGIIGSVNLRGTVKSEQVSYGRFFKVDGFTFFVDDKELAFGDYSPGRFGFLVSNPVKFATVIPYRGELGIKDFKRERIIESEHTQTAIGAATIQMLSSK